MTAFCRGQWTHRTPSYRSLLLSISYRPMHNYCWFEGHTVISRGQDGLIDKKVPVHMKSIPYEVSWTRARWCYPEFGGTCRTELNYFIPSWSNKRERLECTQIKCYQRLATSILPQAIFLVYISADISFQPASFIADTHPNLAPKSHQNDVLEA